MLSARTHITYREDVIYAFHDDDAAAAEMMPRASMPAMPFGAYAISPRYAHDGARRLFRFLNFSSAEDDE